MHATKAGRPVVVGDQIKHPAAPFVVAVEALVECEPNCEYGAAAITDPESGEPDEVCLGTMVHAV